MDWIKRNARQHAERLGYEQGLFLVNLAQVPEPVELSAACEEAGCSWSDAYVLHDRRLVQLQVDENKGLVMAFATSEGMHVAEAFSRIVEERTS